MAGLIDTSHMTALLIVAHAPLAGALRAVAAHAFPDVPVQAVDVAADWSIEEAQGHIQKALDLGAGSDVLILTDVFGATPSNAAQRLVDGQRIRMVAGVNVAMLWRALAYREEPLDKVVGRAVAGATQGIVQAASLAPQRQPLHLEHHDQDHAHHQQ